MSDLAREFHRIYEKLAPEYGYSTREDTKEFDPESPNGKLMIAVCYEVAGKRIEELETLEREYLEMLMNQANTIQELWSAGRKPPEKSE